MSFRKRLQNNDIIKIPHDIKVEDENFIFSKNSGYGILEEFLLDKNVDKIFVNNNNIYVEKKGREYKTNSRFNNSDELLNIIDNLASNSKQNVDKDKGVLNFKLEDGTRVFAVLPPQTPDFPILLIRKIKDITGSLESLVGLDSISKEISLFLEAIINLDLNILISGLENSGKTTLLGAISKKIGNEKRILTVETTPELKLNQEQVIRLCSVDDDCGLLLNQGVKFNPNKIILGDCDKNSAKYLLDASISGKKFVTSIVADSSSDALKKIQNMVETNKGKSNFDIKELVLDNIDVILHLIRFENGSIKLSEVSVINHKTSELDKIFYWDYTNGIGGRFYSCGIKPEFLEGTGFEISDLIFEKEYVHTNGSKEAEQKNLDDIDNQIKKLYSYPKVQNLFKKFKK